MFKKLIPDQTIDMTDGKSYWLIVSQRKVTVNIMDLTLRSEYNERVPLKDTVFSFRGCPVC
jgi:hypothetical protein